MGSVHLFGAIRLRCALRTASITIQQFVARGAHDPDTVISRRLRGGKSLEIRRFGFNLDHGGVSGGLKVLVDDVQQNQATQGHGQGYLGSLKSLMPELVEEVNLINGPFSAEYGDFSGLGVVHIRTRETMPDVWT